MKHPVLFTLSALFVAFAALLCKIDSGAGLSPARGPADKKMGPVDWVYIQRSYPDMGFDVKAYREALSEARENRQVKTGLPGFNDHWVLEGPLNINGRVNCIAVHPQNPDIIFAGSASGGIFKTINGGNTWTPVFDDFSYLAVGDISFDPQNPNIMYAGTGDPNISGYPFIGVGVFKSTDGGSTWNYSGLDNTFIVSRICINPKRPDTLYAATMGLPFLRDNNRGLYMSTDGGQNWAQKLFISNQAGIIDLILDPQNPDSIYAAAWDRIRNNQESVVSGPAAKIYKSYDAAGSWTPLTNGLPSTNMCRIGLCISALNSQVLYASYVGTSLNLEGIYKTMNGGQTWTSVDISTLPWDAMGSFGWYFGQIRVNPGNDNEIYVLGVDLWRRPAAGGNWEMAAPSWDQYLVHADKHDLVFLNSNTFLLATDGGIYKTTNLGVTWADIDNIPSTQFYRVNTNPHEPGIYYGGAQDNGTLRGGAAQISSWTRVLGADGFQPLFDPYDPDIQYFETQYGSLYYVDSWGFYDFTTGIDPNDRRSWDMPIIMSGSNHQKIFTGTYRVYKHIGAPYGSWQAISGDLTDGVIYGNQFHVITTVAESPVDSGMLYAGTSDGNVWRSLNAGNTWDNVTTTLPDRYVTHIIPSPDNASTVFVAHSGYKSNDFIPHIHKSVNHGTTWTDISGNLPQLAINNLEIPAGFDDNIIFAATDGGVYATIDGGVFWSRLGNNLPVVAVYDIVYDTAFHKLVAGTYGRGMHSYSLDSLFNYYNSLTGLKATAATSHALRIFPNPAAEAFRVYNLCPADEISQLKVFDLQGREHPVTWIREDDHLTVSPGLLQQGSYLILVLDRRGKHLGSGKFIRL